jgi:hypothetical protein
MATPVPAELPDNAHFDGDSDRLPSLLGSEPREHGLLKAPATTTSNVLAKEAVELAERELGATIRASQGAFEHQEVGKFLGQGPLEQRCHRGTGRAIARRRRNATRT